MTKIFYYSSRKSIFLFKFPGNTPFFRQKTPKKPFMNLHSQASQNFQFFYQFSFINLKENRSKSHLKRELQPERYKISVLWGCLPINRLYSFLTIFISNSFVSFNFLPYKSSSKHEKLFPFLLILKKRFFIKFLCN